MSNKILSIEYDEILVATVGLTPETVTETIYYFYKQSNKKRLFSKFYLITTNKGKEEIVKSLFKNKNLEKLEKALAVEKDSISLSEKDIIVIKDNSGKPIEDVRNTENANQERLTLFKIFNYLTKASDNRLTVSIAGGRKTMSASIALALQLYGREQDELIHVMVPEIKRRENITDPWFFPQSDDEKIEVSVLPIIKTRKLIENRLPFDNPSKLQELAQLHINELSPIEKVIIDRNEIRINAENIQIAPFLMMVWRYLSRNKIDMCKKNAGETCDGLDGCYVSHSKMMDEFNTKILTEYGLIVGKESEKYRKLKFKLDKIKDTKGGIYEIDANLRQYRSKLKQELTQKVPVGLQSQLLVDIIEDKDGTALFGLKLKKETIEFIN